MRTPASVAVSPGGVVSSVRVMEAPRRAPGRRGAGVAARSERWARVCLGVGLPAEWAALSQPARVRAPAPPRMRARTPQAIKLNTPTRSATTCAILARCRLTYIPR